ncbi:hypothetical protein PN434_08285 [Microcystis aeruginosa CS-558/01A06]|uniref:Uncharacterized protein n=1 Tax=Microcystis aeruginosa BLCC-F108 TaxID=2755317 RepID=A0A841USU2_MICAE|nr:MULTISPECIES: hypothetical protein [Microcystis]MBC1191206.1 hypothetical protein [Microcystis aeruginosa BLCC-F108]MCA2591204.1 hypothetical protein [Microcystis sp. M31BS1]MDB9408528.1 hypothetical protein [Microcystis aeruginosa CS-558/01A06]
MLANHQNQTFVRNYLIAVISVVMMGAGVADLVNNPSRIAQQNRLDGYGRYVSAGLVSGAVNNMR